MSKPKSAKPRTAKSAKPKTPRTAKTGERTSKRKPSPEVTTSPDVELGTPEVSATPAPAVNLANPEVSSPTNPTTSSLLATTANEVVVATQIKPLFFSQQPKDRAVPALSPDDFAALRANIQELGRILVPITITATGVVIDGYARLQIASELDLFCPWIVENIGDDQISSLARTLNLARRHLNDEQKRQLIADELVEDAEAAKLGENRRSFSLIVLKLGVACNTVIKVAKVLTASGKITPITESVGADGKVRSAPKPRNPKPKGIAAEEPAKTAETADAATSAIASSTATAAPAAGDTAAAASAPTPATEVVPVEPGMPRIFEPGPALAATATEPGPDSAKVADDVNDGDQRGDQPPGAFTRIVLHWLRDLRLAETDLYGAIESGHEGVTLDSIDSFFSDHPDALPADARFDVATNPANA